MNDYDKLKKAHELAHKLPFEDWSIGHNYGIGDYCHYYSLVFDDNEYKTQEYECKCIDDLIELLEVLIKPGPEPKYNVDQQVWFLNCNEVDTSLVRKVVINPDVINYVIADGHMSLNEAALFPTKQALIEAQLAYWQSLKEPDIQSCQHESDGKSYLTMPPKHKCLKCGEFYK